MDNQKDIKLIIEETSGIERASEPVTVGVPFPGGFLSDVRSLSILDAKVNPVPLQTEILAKWPDQSIKWVLLDFPVDCPPNTTTNYSLTHSDAPAKQRIHDKEIKIKEVKSSLEIDTGKAVFCIDNKVFNPFSSVKISGKEIIDSKSSFMVLKDEAQEEFMPIIENTDIETHDPIRCTIKTEGVFRSKKGKDFADFFARLSFYAGRSLVKIDFTIRNPNAAEHPGGFWDLGDKGSVYFDDLSFNLALLTKQESTTFWKTKINQNMQKLDGTELEIYQDSSGGENWNSPNHVNKDGKVMNSFSGYKVKSNNLLEEGDRATPTIIKSSGNTTIAATIKNFWQNFPKSLEAKDNSLTVRLFPKQYNDLFELQGGEQKTHTCYLNFDNNKEHITNIDWINNPLIPRATPEWYSESMAVGYMSPANKDKNSDYQKLVDNVIDGDASAFNSRESIDEYGWRHFGDVYANHEIANYKGTLLPHVSHYNNQYDVINGCILQFARTGELKWYELMNDLAKHAIDIDVYHTKSDRLTYNHGFFWHTDHFMHAQTSTHRSFSKKNIEYNPGISRSYCASSGGLSPENCYTTGLAMYYYLTGNVMAKEAVIGLADWIINFDRTSKSFLGILRKIKRIMTSFLNKYGNVPERLRGNSINTLLDGFEITDDRKYLIKAEQIIRKYISPSDDVDKLDQQQIELRWTYLVFLQALGKYLDVKEGINEKDRMFNYAKESLLHHAGWMLKNEVPYKQLFKTVEIQSSTWPAQDTRKSVIFDYACKYSDGHLKNAFEEKAEFFYNTSIYDVLSYGDESKYFVRPLAIMMNYGVMHTYFQNMTNV